MATAKLSEAEAGLCATIARRAGDMEALLERLVAIPTGMNYAPGLDEARGVLTARLAALGSRVELVAGEARPAWLDEREGEAGPVPPTAVCTRLGVPRAGARLLLGGHLDTVHDPRGPFQRLERVAGGRRATGPGCADMKGGLVIALVALEALEECGVRASWAFFLNSDEETGSFHSDRAIREAARGLDAGLVMEPALPDGGLVTHRPGSGQFRLLVTGKPAHVGRDFSAGVSAIDTLASCITVVRGMVDLPAGRIANVGVIRGGVATNVVSPSAVAWGNVRFRTPGDGEAMKRAIEALGGVGPARVEVDAMLNRPAKPLVPAVEALANLARSVASDLGQDLPFGTTGGVCDGNNMQEAGLPTIDTLGVRGGGLHTPEEWIDLGSLVPRCQLIAVLMARLTERGVGGVPTRSVGVP
jgi:glutamate carboxypeptidase